MNALGQFLLPVGFFVAFFGVILVTNSPFMREMLGQVEFLQENRRVIGAMLMIFGIVLMWLSISV